MKCVTQEQHEHRLAQWLISRASTAARCSLRTLSLVKRAGPERARIRSSSAACIEQTSIYWTQVFALREERFIWKR